jgi:hypothetical protein
LLIADRSCGIKPTLIFYLISLSSVRLRAQGCLVRTEGFLGALVGVLSGSGKRRTCCCRYLVKKINRCQAGNV